MRWWVALFWAIVIVVPLLFGVEYGKLTITHSDGVVMAELNNWSLFGQGRFTQTQIIALVDEHHGDTYEFRSRSIFGGSTGMSGSYFKPIQPIITPP